MTEPAVTHPLSDQLIELIAQRFRVLAEPMRIKLLDQLRDSDATVSELQQALGASQQNVSKHLAILHSAGMVTRTKHGNTVRYAIATTACSSSANRSWRRAPPTPRPRSSTRASHHELSNGRATRQQSAAFWRCRA